MTTKYRRGVLTEEITGFIRAVIQGFADNYGVKINHGEDDHVHVLFKAKPITDLVRFVNTTKAATARRVRSEFEEELKDKRWGDSFWTSSYCLISTEQVSLDYLMKYVEEQRD